MASTAALMLELNPNLSPDQIKATLMMSAERVEEDPFTAVPRHLGRLNALAEKYG